MDTAFNAEVVNMGGLDLVRTYLWLYCADATTDGVSRLRLSMDFFGVLLFLPSVGIVDSDPAPFTLDLVIPDCSRGSLLLGELRYSGATGSCFGLPVVKESAVYYCNAPGSSEAFAMIPYAESNPKGCIVDSNFWNSTACQPPVSIERDSWGRLKAMYR